MNEIDLVHFSTGSFFPNMTLSCFRLFFVLLPVAGMLSCGYSSEPMYRYDTRSTTIAVPVFENRTRWRELEKNLTDNVVEKVTSRTPFRLVDYDDADLVIRGEITGFSRPVLSEDQLDSVVRSSVRYQVKVEIQDRETGDVLQTESNNFRASFSGARGKREEAALNEAQDRVGAWVVRVLETNKW